MKPVVVSRVSCAAHGSTHASASSADRPAAASADPPGVDDDAVVTERDGGSATVRGDSRAVAEARCAWRPGEPDDRQDLIPCAHAREEARSKSRLDDGPAVRCLSSRGGVRVYSPGTRLEPNGYGAIYIYIYLYIYVCSRFSLP